MNRKLLAVFLLLIMTQLGNRSYGMGDTLRLGNGSTPITVNGANTIINAYARITSAAPVGQSFITVASTTGFSVGSLVMIWQTTGYAGTVTSGSQTTVNLSAEKTGTWEFARVQSLTATRLNFSAPLINAFNAAGAQAVLVPQFSSVTINAGASIVAQPWDGTTGGIVAFLATGTVTNNGVISASGNGFRGAPNTVDAGGSTGVTNLDQPLPAAGRKGEGIVPVRFGTTTGTSGRGNIIIGGGGGSGLLAGGGGGAHAGTGGNGGRTAAADGSRNAGGLGGGDLVYNPVSRLLMGGGGGAGHSTAGTGIGGGNGGGVVFFRANALSGTGAVVANGDDAPAAATDAGCGGGAGGSLYVRLAGAAACGTFSATGGKGGNASTGETGTGGGGGGGSILFQAATGACNPVLSAVSGGVAGQQPVPGALDGLSYGATAGDTGLLTKLNDGLPATVSVAITAPAAAATTVRRPNITGTATANSTVSLKVDATTYTTVADASGNYNYQLSAAEALADGSHTLAVVAIYQGLYSGTVQRSFTTSTALPVSLLSFDAREHKGKVLITWKTAAGPNSHEFVVQRSGDGHSFRQTDVQQAAAAAEEEHSYTSVDASPNSGTNFYRLKIIDKDGSISYSNIIAVKLVGTPVINITENPVHQEATIVVKTATPEPAALYLINGEGKIVRTFQLDAGAVEQRIALKREALAPGIYYLELRKGNGLRLAGEKLVIE